MKYLLLLKQKMFLAMCALSIIYICISMSNTEDLSPINDKLTFDANLCPLFPIATFEKVGRLGNQISSYANFIAMQWIFGYQLYLREDFKEDMKRVLKNISFPTVENISHCKTLSWYAAINPLLPGFFSNEIGVRKEICMLNVLMLNNIIECSTPIKNMDKHSCLPSAFGKILNINIRVGHQDPSWEILADILPELKKHHLQFTDEVMDEANKAFKMVTVGWNKTFVGVHVRRTDYIEFRQNHVGLSEVNQTYFKAAMQFYRDKYPDTTFLVVSDDMDWCKEHITGHDVFHVEGGSPSSDMALMSACNHSIIDYGSYGVWGAALAGGDVVTPQQRFNGYHWQFGSGRLNWTQLEGF